MQLIHANCLTIGDAGLLLLGQSGVGKSAITLALIQRAAQFQRHAILVADDYCQIHASKQGLHASAPDQTKGAMEIRGAGLFSVSYQASVLLTHAVCLEGEGQRYPPDEGFYLYEQRLPMLHLPELDKSDCLVLCQAIEVFLFGKKWCR